VTLDAAKAMAIDAARQAVAEALGGLDRPAAVPATPTAPVAK
jgi:hypothetical protein